MTLKETETLNDSEKVQKFKAKNEHLQCWLPKDIYQKLQLFLDKFSAGTSSAR